MHALSARLVKNKGNFTLDIEVDFIKGITGIFGPSGAGKTSLMHLLAGLDRPDDGFVYIDDIAVVETSKNLWVKTKNRKIGYVFQEGRLFPHMTVRKNLLFGTKYLLEKEKFVEFRELVELLELSDLLDKRPKELSGGEKQRVAIGRALLSSPKLLLMDEPFSSLDVKLRRQIIPYLIKINKKFNIPMLIVSHDLPDLLSLTRELFLLKDGKVVGHGNYLDLIEQENMFDIIRPEGIMNVLRFTVDKHDKKKGLTILINTDAQTDIKVERELIGDCCEIGDEMNVSLRAEDIALTLRQIPDISIRNQLPGTVVKMIQKENRNYCVVDVGFKLIVSITHASQMRMNICEGKKIWCLFKSMALQLNR